MASLSSHVHAILDDHRVVLGINTQTNTIPQPPSPSPTEYPYFDGTWGPNEWSRLPFAFDMTSPYLAWIPLSWNGELASYHIQNTVLDFRLSPGDFEPETPRSPQGRITKHRLKDIEKEISYYRQTLPKYIAVLRSFPGEYAPGWKYCDVQVPDPDMVASRHSWAKLDGWESSYADAELVLATLRRSVVELQAFIIWVQQAPHFHPDRTLRPASYVARGSYAKNPAEYNYLRLMGVPAYIITPRPVAFTSGSILVDIISWNRTLTNRRREDCLPEAEHNWFGNPKRFHHTWQLYCYPPHVRDPLCFEKTARGFGGARLDTHNIHPRFGQSFRRWQHEAREKTLQVKRQDIQRSNDIRKMFGLPPLAELKDLPSTTWHPLTHLWLDIVSTTFSESQFIRNWTNAPAQIVWPSHYPDPTSPARLVPVWKSTCPPPYLFRTQNHHKLQFQLYVLRCIMPVWFHRISNVTIFDDSQCALSTQQWRDVLHGSYWKSQWPVQGRRFNPTVDPLFEPAFFWKYGGPAILGEVSEPEKLALRPNLRDGTPLGPEHFESKALRDFVLWDLSVLHTQLCFQAADELYSRATGTGDEIQQRIERRAKLFRGTWGSKLIYKSPPWESELQCVRRPWLKRLRDFVKEWDLPPGSNFFTCQHNFDTDLMALSASDYDLYENCLVRTIMHCIIHGYNVLPPLLVSQPPLEQLESYFDI